MRKIRISGTSKKLELRTEAGENFNLHNVSPRKLFSLFRLPQPDSGEYNAEVRITESFWDKLARGCFRDLK